MPSPAAANDVAPLLQARGLTHRYDRSPVILDLDFELHAGRVTAFLGRNGAGKTTTLSLLAGLLAPTAGTIAIDGRPPHRDRKARARIGYLPERPPLYPQLRVDEHLAFAACLHGITRSARRSAIDAVVEQFELSAVRRRMASKLSKGYQQRLGLAMAVVHRPPLVLLDEPGSGLDPVQLAALRSQIRALSDGAAVLYSTHMLNEALAIADDLLVLCDGRLTYAGPVDQAPDDPSMEACLLALMSGEGAAG